MLSPRRTTAALATTLTLGLAVPTAMPTPARAVALPAVTNGWSAVILGKSTFSAPGTLYMVSPAGKQYRVGPVAALWSVMDVSNDGRRVLLANHQGNYPAHVVVDTRTGVQKKVQGTWWEARFANGLGSALLAVDTATGRLWRTDLAGKKTFVFQNSGHQLAGDPTPDGRTVVVPRGFDGLTVANGTNGRTIRRVNLPVGVTSCSFGHWLTGSKFTVSCSPSAKDQRRMVYIATTTGTPATVLTRGITRTMYTQFGFNDSWGTKKGQVVMVGVGCGAAPLARVSGSKVTQVSRRGDANLGVVGSTLFNTHGMTTCERPATQLVKHDLVTGKVQLLAGGTKNPGLVVKSVALVDATR